MELRFKTPVVALLVVAGIAPVAAQYRDRVTSGEESGSENVAYAYADVLRVDPIYEVVRVLELPVECRDPGKLSATSGPASATQTQDISPPTRSVKPDRCRNAGEEREDKRVVGYDVEYRFKGEIFVSRLDYDPGNKLRVRITVTPAD